MCKSERQEMLLLVLGTPQSAILKLKSLISIIIVECGCQMCNNGGVCLTTSKSALLLSLFLHFSSYILFLLISHFSSTSSPPLITIATRRTYHVPVWVAELPDWGVESIKIWIEVIKIFCATLQQRPSSVEESCICLEGTVETYHIRNILYI